MNTKKLFTLLIIAIFVSNFASAQISKTEILNASKGFVSTNTLFKNYSYQNEVHDLYSQNEIVAHLVNLKPEGYVIFTASKSMYPVFSYSEKGSFNLKELKNNTVINAFLGNLQKQQNVAKTKASEYASVIQKNQNAWSKLLNSNKEDEIFDHQFGHYVTNIWGGVNCWDYEGHTIYPSSYFTPNHYSPGCVAISAAQILKHYNWPPVGTGSHYNYDNNGSSQGTYYARFGTMKYDWNNILDDYQRRYSSDTEQRAIGRLMYHVGVAVDMDYENEGSTSHVNRVSTAFQNYFRMIGHYETRSWGSFRTRLQENIENLMIVQFGISSTGGDQHACVCDGYRYNDGDVENDKFYHLNMGWWNWYGGNAWYKIFDDFDAVGYSIITGGVFDILPKPMINSVVRSNNPKTFSVNWKVSENLMWTAFELEEKFEDGSWTLIDNNITDTIYERTVTLDGRYRYRVRAKVNGAYYADSYSNVGVVQVGQAIFLDFDGNDSFYVTESSDNLDVVTNWTYEAWVNVDDYTDGDWSVIMDRVNVFSLYLIDDANADFAVRFAVRDIGGAMLSTLRSDNSSVNLALNKWFHVAVTRDGTTARLFINGILIEESTHNDYLLTSSANALNVGARYWNSNYERYFDGQIDELRISSKARYTEEFCPDRFDVLKDDNKTRLLLNFQYGTGESLFDASYHFLSVNLRSSPNLANWASEEVPIINVHPSSQALNSGNASFVVNATNTDNYQWEINNGTGFANFVDNGNVTGATTNSLQIADVTTFAEDNIVRCIVSNTNTPKSCSNDAIFQVYSNSTVWDGTNWSNGLPSTTKSAIINGDFTSADHLNTKNLKINTGNTLYISENNTLSVNGKFINEGSLVLMSENADQIPGSFIHTDEVINQGSFTVQKKFETPFAEGIENSTLFSSPINTTEVISTLFTNTPTIFSNNGRYTNWDTLEITDNITKGKPYLFQSNTDDLITFNGTFNSGTISKELKVLGNDDAFMFISNPYPSYINLKTATGWDNENLSPALYTYDLFNNGNSNNYSVWDGTLGLHSGNGYVKPLEAYFLYVEGFRANIQSTNDVRVSTEDVETTYPTPTNLIRFKFETLDEATYDEAVIYFGDTENLTLKTLPLSNSKFYTFMPSSGRKYAIKKLVNPTLDTIVSVGFKSPQAQQIRFKITEFNFDASTPVQLKDLWIGNFTTLQLGTTYEFSAGSYEPDNRFKIYFGDYVVAINDVENNSIKAWSNNKTIFIENSKQDNFNYTIFDVSGKIIKEGKSNSNITKIQNLANGIKILKITNKNISKIFKLSIY